LYEEIDSISFYQVYTLQLGTISHSYFHEYEKLYIVALSCSMYATGPLGNIEKHLENVETHIGLAWAKSISDSAPLRGDGSSTPVF